MNRIPLNGPAEVRPAEDLAEFGRRARAELDAEDAAVRESVEHAILAGEWLKKAWTVTAPQHRWNAWLDEQDIPRERAGERIRIYDNRSRLPAESASKGVSWVLNWLRPQTPLDTQPVDAEQAQEVLEEADERVQELLSEVGKLPETINPSAVKDLHQPQKPDPRPAEFITLAEWDSWDKARRQRFLEVLKDVPSGSKSMNFQGDLDEGNPNIEWALWSWNPVTGCLHNCPYCYARDIAERFYEPKFNPAFWPGRLDAPHNVKVPAKASEWMGYKNVFVCSMADLFGRWVPREWIDAVLREVRAAAQWNFLFLTKFPVRMAEFDFPENAWVGTTVDCQARVANAERSFRKVRAGVKWLSIEPMIEPLKFNDLAAFDWIVLGGSSRSSQTPEWHPPRQWVHDIEEQAKAAEVRFYEKSNLLQRIRHYPGVEMEAEANQAPKALRYLPSPETL